MMEPPSEEQVVKVEEERRRGIVKMDSLEVEGEVVYDREGVIVQAKREDRLHSGRLKVTDTRCEIQPYQLHANIFSHGVFLTWDLELAIQQSASMVTPEKVSGRGGAGSGRRETSLDDYGIPRDCVVGSPPSRFYYYDHQVYFIKLTKHCPVTGLSSVRTMVTRLHCTESGISSKCNTT